MTIIQPNQNKTKFSFAAVFIIGLILLGAILSILAYNQSVRLHNNLETELGHIKDWRAQNADFKKQLYALLDLQNADELARKFGLVKERKPGYLAVQ